MSRNLYEQEQIASAATATASFIVNLQLNDWTEAKAKFFMLRDRTYHWSEATKIVNLLGNSLTTLFGMNYQSQGRTPPLFAYVENNFYDKGWNLKSDNPELHGRFAELDDLHKDVTKHMDSTKAEKAKQALATMHQLARQMETTRLTWIWFLQKRAGSQAIPADQLAEFQERFE
jgi:hypothetical protein